MPSLNETIRELEKTKLREQSACWKDVADAALREKMSDIRADSQFSPTPRFRTYGDTRRASSQKRPSNRKRARKSAKPSALDLRYANGIQTVSQQCDAIATVILPTRRTTIEHVHSSQHRLEDTAHYSHSEGRQISAVPELQGTSRLDNGVQHWSSEPNCNIELEPMLLSNRLTEAVSLFGVEGLEEFFGPFIFMGMNLSIKRSKDSTSFLTEAAQLWLPSEPYLNAKLGIWVQDSYGGCIEALLNSPSYSKEDLRFLLGDFLFGSTRAGIDEKALAVTILNDSNGDRKLEIILGFQDAVRLWQTDKGAELPS
ncbi:hypothetical protein K491DRAFT_720551 [Lophiostoma macrostomum CBS 122681]|uniref:Uncharacterized protein n=1 Tax=Lophiostoma macrostomum CBS 122681 TaxID=1314788 RepID=A0A6A6SSD2_9PLEO|nr:hypothetical protein K491DRAFT_720551 [Lophiostoma macrostomum CBS 122681]